MAGENIKEDREAYNGEVSGRFKSGDSECGGIATLCGIGGYDGIWLSRLRINSRGGGSSNTRSAPRPSSSAWKSNQWRKEEKPPSSKPKT